MNPLDITREQCRRCLHPIEKCRCAEDRTHFKALLLACAYMQAAQLLRLGDGNWCDMMLFERRLVNHWLLLHGLELVGDPDIGWTVERAHASA